VGCGGRRGGRAATGGGGHDRPVRPYVILSCAVSLDGFIDDDTPRRLMLSGPEDLDRVDELRASCDAILVGAGTVRADNPRLVLRSPARRAARIAAGRPATPLRVALTGSGELDPARALFGTDDEPPLVYMLGAAGRAAALAARLGPAATVAAVGDLPAVLSDLAPRGVERLLVEGGTAVHTAVLAGGLADELRLAVAPLLVGAAGGARFVGPAAFPPGRLRLLDAGTAGDMAVLRYALRAGSQPGGNSPEGSHL
jgi:5-amino-6-(5-phosphoribosylamino)uracil reductase